MTYPESVDWLLSTQLFGMKLGLDNMRRLVSSLGHPAVDLRFVHVAGTNGKGSTCAFVEALARTHGLHTGLYTSPHLMDVRERFQIDRAMISEDEFARHATRLREIVADWDPHPTYFELTTAIALLSFDAHKVDLVAWETGMGGRLDATSVVHPAVSVITRIAIDHTNWLGDTLGQIACEKAGVIKPGVPVVMCEQTSEAARAIREAAQAGGCPLAIAPPLPPGVRLGLSGEHQRVNAALALEALRAAGVALDESATLRALAGTLWPGRLHEVQEYLLDGAHNPDGLRSLVVEWRSRFGSQKAVVVFGALVDKDTTGLLRTLSEIAGRICFAPVKSSRGAPPADLAALAREIVPGLPVQVCASVAEAIGLAASHRCPGGPPVLVTGSLFLVGECLDLLGPGNAASAARL